jgi:hypothetical protein
LPQGESEPEDEDEISRQEQMYGSHVWGPFPTLHTIATVERQRCPVQHTVLYDRLTGK